MIENFMEGHILFNSLREQFGLPQIEVRDHNTFFNRDQLIDSTATLFDVVERKTSVAVTTWSQGSFTLSYARILDLPQIISISIISSAQTYHLPANTGQSGLFWSREAATVITWLL